MPRDPGSFLENSSQYRADNPATPEAPKVKAAPAAKPSSAGSGALPPSNSGPSDDAAPLAKSGGPSNSYTVSDGGIYAFSDTEATKVGDVTLAPEDAEKVLKGSGAVYDEHRGTYDNVPEATIKLLRAGPQSLASEVKERFGKGLAEFHRASLGMALAGGEMTAEDMRQRSQPDLAQLQLDAHPGAAWKGLGKALNHFTEHPADDTEDFLKQSIAKTAEAMPSIADLVNQATVGTVVGGAAAAMLGPEAIPIGMKLGGAAGTFLSLYHQELGTRMAALADQGLDDKAIHAQAPAAAVKSAVGAGIFMYGVDAMAAPFKARVLKALAADTPAAKAAVKEMSSWAYNYGVNAGIKMPAVGVVHQMASDLMDNLGALVDKRPDLMKSPLEFSNNAIEAAAGMAQLGLVAGAPGAVFEAGGAMLDRRAEARLAAEMDQKLKGVERREPLAPSSPSGQNASPSGEQTPGPSGQTPSSAPAGETPQVPPENSSPPPQPQTLPESIKDHPAYVKAVEKATPDLPEGVKPTDGPKVVDAYRQASQEAIDYDKSVADAIAEHPLTPDEQNHVSAQIDMMAQRVANLLDLAQFTVDPEGKAAHEDWKAGGQEGTEPPLADPLAPAAKPESTPEQKLDETLANKDAKPADVVKAASSAAERMDEKVQSETVKGRAAEVKSNLDALQQRIGEIASTRDRMQKNGMSTGAIDRQLNKLIDQAVGAQKEAELLAQREPGELEVSKRAKLEVKPATLQDITDIAFKEGGKQSQERARELLAIAQENGLTAADVKKLIGNKAIGAMGDTAYKNFLDGFEREGENGQEAKRTPGFREGVEKLVERKKARAEVASVLQEKQLEKEQYIRQLNGLPAFSKMTTEQLRSYADILRAYDKGDEALSPKRIKALEGIVLEGANGKEVQMGDVKTLGDVRKKGAELTGLPLKDFKNVKVSLFARAIPDPQLRQWFPSLRPFVDLAGLLGEKGDRLAEVVRGRNEELAAAAIKERRATLGAGAKIADWLAPQQREVMAYLEAKEPADVVAAAEKLTPAEAKWANFLKAWFSTSEDYLVKKEGMTSRFSGSYAPHVNRGWPEIMRDLKEQGVLKSLKEFLPQAQGKNADFVDAQGNVLGFNKFFKQSMFRSGALEPSKNVVEAANQYISDFYRKAALDQAAPVLDTLARAMKAEPEMGLDPRQNEAMTSSLQDFVKAWVNNKKGINNSAGAMGELLAPALRMSQTLAAIHYIAGNYALQAIKGSVAIPISEYMVLGTDLFKAKALKYTDQGKAILEKYQSFTGKSPWEEVKRPGADAQDFARALTYGGFGMAHKAAMEDLLLGSMTKAEFAAGSISDARLNEIRQHAGRWMDLSRSDSIVGSSVPGKTFTQYKGWAIPPTLTLGEDARALARQVVGKGKMSEVQVREALRLTSLAAVAVTAGTLATKDMEDDSFRGQAVHYLRRALGSVWRGADMSFWMSAAGPGYVAKLAADLHLLTNLERQEDGSYDVQRYKTGEHAGDTKGWVALKKDLTPRIVKDAQKVVEED